MGAHTLRLRSQTETDYFWEKLAADGGRADSVRLTKRQIRDAVADRPGQGVDRLRDDDPARVQRVTAALWQMQKLDLADLDRAAG